MDGESRICSWCGFKKPLNEFRFLKGKPTRCIPCDVKRCSDWKKKDRVAHPEKYKEASHREYIEAKTKNTEDWRSRRRAALRKYSKKHRERLSVAEKAWREANKDRVKNNTKKWTETKGKAWALKHNYNMTIDDYDKMIAKQGHVCKICGGTQSTKGLVVDHDHKTGVVRGILCSHCNSGLGFFKDNVQVLLNAVAYLTGNKDDS